MKHFSCCMSCWFSASTEMPEPLVASNHDCQALLAALELKLPQETADVC